jgi:GH24 family phage-related lysozyme (muramidase)
MERNVMIWLLPIALFGSIIVFSSTRKNDTTPEHAKIDLDTAAGLSKAEIKEKEGLRLEVYEDSLGHLTIGYGHLILPADGLKIGDTITKEKADAFFDSDFQKAFNAAVLQASELGKTEPRFIAALASVNYQLGTNWNKEFKNTWALLKGGNAFEAINNLKASKWNNQTPKRVNAFVDAIQNAYA